MVLFLYMIPVSIVPTFRKSLFRRVAVLMFVIVVLNTTATLFYWYSTIWWFDIPMHFLGGFFVSLLAAWVFSTYIPLSLQPKTVKEWILLILIAVFIVGVLWEAYELVVDSFTRAGEYGYLDGTSDMFNDLAGGMLGLISLLPYFSKDT
jgi:hypothetical protein